MAKRAKSINQLKAQYQRIEAELNRRNNVPEGYALFGVPDATRLNKAWRAYVDYTDNIGNAEIKRRGLRTTDDYRKAEKEINKVRYKTSAYVGGTRSYRDGVLDNKTIQSKGNIVG